MNWIALATAWAAVSPFLEKLGKGLKKLWSLIKKYWKQLVLIAALIFIGSFLYNAGKKSGLAESDDAWVARYNEAVKEFNDRMKAVGGHSDDLVKVVDKATEKVEVDLDLIDKRVVDEAKKPEHTVQCAPNGKATLNTQLPPELFKAWADMNEAGAKNNPFAEKIKETK